MIRTTDRDTQSGGNLPPLPPILDLPGVDEGPMRQELKRQIQQLEHDIAAFHVENCPYEAFSASPARGPAVLTNEQLEQVRDELTDIRAELHERVTTRDVDSMLAGLEAAAPREDEVGIVERLKCRLLGRR